MIDIAPNLCNKQFDEDLGNVIQNAKNANIKGLILTSTDIKSLHKNLSIIKEFGNILPMKTTYGLHPHNADNYKECFIQIDKHLSNPDVAAIGEFGLDYNRMNAKKENQIYVMKQFLIAAKKNPHLPLFLHERDSFNDFYNILKDSNTENKAVVHCFTGNKEQVKKYIDLGCYIGITGWISDNKRNSDVVEALKYIPLDRLMIETDCPYLTPRNMRTSIRRNEPAFLIYVAKSVSKLLNIPLEEVISTTEKNSLDFFNLKGYNLKNKL